MIDPYVLVSDIHCHSWSQFSTIGPNGVNTRLQIILDELRRAARMALSKGVDRMVVAGDTFHVRGKIEPSVFNPTYDCFRELSQMGMQIDIIPGNHDLEGSYADRLGNAMQQLDQIDQVNVVTEPLSEAYIQLVPWIENLDELREVCKANAAADKDLVIHAPLNGVLKGLPDVCLDPAEVAAWGYKRVFCGHFHNHKEFDGGVFSIGATTHQTWSDPGTQAGFLIVTDTDVEFHETNAPKFVNIDNVGQITRGALNGNYARLRLVDAEPDVIEKAKQDIQDCGALNLVDHSSKKRETIRQTKFDTANITLEASVAGYVDTHLKAGKLDRNRIATEALSVLTEARSVGNE